MIELTEAINTRLSTIFGQDNVYFGTARKAKLPYITFINQDSSPSEYHACNRGKGVNTGVITTFPFMIRAWADTDTVSRRRIQDIIDSFEKSEIAMPKDKLLMVETITQVTNEDPEQSAEGLTVWSGTAIIEFRISKGA